MRHQLRGMGTPLERGTLGASALCLKCQQTISFNDCLRVCDFSYKITENSSLKLYEEAFESSLLEIYVERYLLYSQSDYLCILTGKIGVKKYLQKMFISMFYSS